MAKINPSDMASPLPSSGNKGNAMVFMDSAVIAANLAAADEVRLCRVSAGTKVHRVVVENPDLDSGSNLLVDLGFANIDGSAGPSLTALADDAATWQAAAVTTYEVNPPVLLTKDAYLVATVDTGGVGTGTVYGKVEGEGLGVK